MRTALLIKTAALVVAGGVRAAPMLNGVAVGEVVSHTPVFQSEIVEEAASHPHLSQYPEGWSSASSDVSIPLSLPTSITPIPIPSGFAS